MKVYRIHGSTLKLWLARDAFQHGGSLAFFTLVAQMLRSPNLFGGWTVEAYEQ
jgi:hypothetical protein